MDSTTYTRLRDRLRQEEDESKARVKSICEFLDKLREHVNDLAGQEKYRDVCSWGRINASGVFEKDDYAGGYSDFTFALEISFFDRGGKRIYSVAIPFTAHWGDESLRIDSEYDSVSVHSIERMTKPALTKIAALIDRPLRERVDGYEWDPDEM